MSGNCKVFAGFCTAV